MVAAAKALPAPPTSAPIAYSRRRERATRWLAYALLVSLGLILLAPLASIFAAWSKPVTEAWQHLASTLLAEYVWTSFKLVVAVATLASVMGVSSAFFVSQFEFRGRRALEWLLVLPLAAPAYVIAYAYTDFLQVSGPLQSGLRQLTGWGIHDYSFPEVRSLPGAALWSGCWCCPWPHRPMSLRMPTPTSCK
jgi:iron(III) transport system permease protein